MTYKICKLKFSPGGANNSYLLKILAVTKRDIDNAVCIIVIANGSRSDHSRFNCNSPTSRPVNMPADQPQVTGSETNGNASPPQEKPKLRPCCACPETKKARDECIIERGEENCGDLIEKHKQCMRDLGFKI